MKSTFLEAPFRRWCQDCGRNS